MYRIDNATAAGAIPASTADGPNPDGFFTDGDPGGGTPATVVDAEWLNTVQEEIAQVIADGGGALDKSDNTQLSTAIQALIAAVPSTPTGTVSQTASSTAPSGWLLMDGTSIGDVGSGATFSNAGAEALFTVLWDSMTDTHAPVSGGRGASAAADWAAGKTLTMPDARGRAIIGAGTGSGLTARTLGDDTIGEEIHTLTEAEMPAHTHTNGLGSGGSLTAPGGGTLSPAATGSTGGGGAHNNMQPSIALNTIIKL